MGGFRRSRANGTEVAFLACAQRAAMRTTTAPPLNTPERQRSRHQSSHPKSNGNKSDSSPQTAAPEIENYHELVARATNDAVRDWNLITDGLVWRQGLDTLLGWKPASGDTIVFWQKRIHPDDRERVTASIRDAIKSDTDHWSGEYRFQRADGTYLNVLERAIIHRDKSDGAKRFVGVLMDITAHRHLGSIGLLTKNGSVRAARWWCRSRLQQSAHCHSRL